MKESAKDPFGVKRRYFQAGTVRVSVPVLVLENEFVSSGLEWLAVNLLAPQTYQLRALFR